MRAVLVVVSAGRAVIADSQLVGLRVWQVVELQAAGRLRDRAVGQDVALARAELRACGRGGQRGGRQGCEQQRAA